MDFLKEIGTRIRTLRQQCGLSQDDLAHMAGYTSRSSINKVEKGLVDLPQSKISLIASALGVTPTYLLYGDKSPAQSNTPTKNELDEGEKIWLDLYHRISDESRSMLVKLVDAFDNLPTEERQFLLSVIELKLKK
jgi:transcriptional regulator with XRE-family HTH domain